MSASTIRRIAYVSGTRADFGLMARTLAAIAASDRLALGVAVTGMHLSPKYGHTVCEIEASELSIIARIPTPVEETTGAAMARGIAASLAGLVDAFERWRPDTVVVLGDRGEMLAGALAAIHLNMPVVHIHGGERSGTIDEPVRHAISKLAHYHFVATDGARERLIRMGERPEHVFTTGAPGLDAIAPEPGVSRASLCAEIGLDRERPIVLSVFHPVLQEASDAGAQASAVLRGALEAGLQVVALMPNADAGGDAVRAALEGFTAARAVRLLTHMPRARFLSWMAFADVLLGNSSAGIIEAASLGLPVVNVGTRQQLRERSGNVVDVPAEVDAIAAALGPLVAAPRRQWTNVYGDGQAAGRIVRLLAELPLGPNLLAKCNAY